MGACTSKSGAGVPRLATIPTPERASPALVVTLVGGALETPTLLHTSSIPKLERSPKSHQLSNQTTPPDSPRLPNQRSAPAVCNTTTHAVKAQLKLPIKAIPKHWRGLTVDTSESRESSREGDGEDEDEAERREEDEDEDDEAPPIPLLHVTSPCSIAPRSALSSPASRRERREERKVTIGATQCKEFNTEDAAATLRA